MRQQTWWIGIVLVGVSLGVACSKPQPQEPVVTSQQTAASLFQQYQKPPQGLFSPPPVPENNPMSVEKVELGYLLYFDKRLSGDGTLSCASCHASDKGWTDQASVSTGINGQKGTRSAPTVLNSAYMFTQFWDGRAKSLEEQAEGPFVNPIEMGLKDHDELVAKVKAIRGYGPYFQSAFGEEKITKETIVQAIASFERTLLGGNSRYDKFSQGDKTALTEAEQNGLKLFFGKGNCTRCHAGSNFSDSIFHNLGVGMNAEKPDLGRYEITKQAADKGAFKTPTVRDITKTAPYMHDGSQQTLEEVVTFYNIGGEKNKWLDFRMVPLNLTAKEQQDLVAFMKALDSQDVVEVAPPTKFPN